jgi:predicted nucleic acid-binding protein
VKVVVDASVALKWVLGKDRPEPNRSEAAALLSGLGDGEHSAVQPVHWVAEILAVVARYDVRRTDRTLLLLNDIPHHVRGSLETYREAARLSAELDHHLFDTLYHALALQENATLVTADQRYFSKARDLGCIVLLRHLRSTRPS